ncbi:hypothetical protein V6N13_010111 [Hibiscus sabdariffa]
MPMRRAKPPRQPSPSSRITSPHAITPSPFRRAPSTLTFTHPCSDTTHTVEPIYPATCASLDRLEIAIALIVQSRNQWLRSITD